MVYQNNFCIGLKGLQIKTIDTKTIKIVGLSPKRYIDELIRLKLELSSYIKGFRTLFLLKYVRFVVKFPSSIANLSETHV